MLQRTACASLCSTTALLGSKPIVHILTDLTLIDCCSIMNCCRGRPALLCAVRPAVHLHRQPGVHVWHPRGGAAHKLPAVSNWRECGSRTIVIVLLVLGWASPGWSSTRTSCGEGMEQPFCIDCVCLPGHSSTRTSCNANMKRTLFRDRGVAARLCSLLAVQRSRSFGCCNAGENVNTANPLCSAPLPAGTPRTPPTSERSW